MVYLPGMEALKSDITKQVVEAMEAYDYDSYTAEDVRCALAKRNRTPEDFAALLSPAAEPFIEEMAQCAKVEKENHFGNSVCFFTPLYIANYCENYCIYCGFNCHNRIRRAKLNAEEIEAEMADFTKRRKEKQPLEYPSAGSTFKRPPGYYTGPLIRQAGLAGLVMGGAQVSKKHTGFVINREEATARDVLRLIKTIQYKVRSQYGVLLEPEVRIFGEDTDEKRGS